MSRGRRNATEKVCATVTPQCIEVIGGLMRRGHWNKSEMIENAIMNFARAFVKQTGMPLKNEKDKKIDLK